MTAILNTVKTMMSELATEFYENNIKQTEIHDGLRTIEEIISCRGFICETHELKTIDGYFLTVHRIINPLNESKIKNPILLQHGLGAHSAQWCINSEDGSATSIPTHPLTRNQVDDSIGFALANSGYDVWMSNIRGSKYSLKHEIYDHEKDPQFWDFNFDDIVEKDIPLFIDHILKTCGTKTLGYIGLSQGTTFMLAMMASKKRYNEIIRPFIAMAPVATTHNVCGQIPVPIKAIAINPVVDWLNRNPGPVVPLDALKFIEPLFVGHRFEKWTNSITNWCNKTFTVQQINGERYHVITAHAGYHLSRKNLAQSLQIHLKNKLQKQDFGPEINFEKYGCIFPPEYMLENISNPYISLIWCKRDDWVRVEDLKTLKRRLSVPLFHEHKVQNRKWNHLDFIIGTRSGYFINAIVLGVLRSVEQNQIVKQG